MGVAPGRRSASTGLTDPAPAARGSAAAPAAPHEGTDTPSDGQRLVGVPRQQLVDRRQRLPARDPASPRGLPVPEIHQQPSSPARRRAVVFDALLFSSTRRSSPQALHGGGAGARAPAHHRALTPLHESLTPLHESLTPLRASALQQFLGALRGGGAEALRGGGAEALRGGGAEALRGGGAAAQAHQIIRSGAARQALPPPNGSRNACARHVQRRHSRLPTRANLHGGA